MVLKGVLATEPYWYRMNCFLLATAFHVLNKAIFVQINYEILFSLLVYDLKIVISVLTRLTCQMKHVII